MKNIIYCCLAIALTAFSHVSAQVVNISDANFLGALIFNKVDKNKNGQIESAEAEAIDSLSVNTIFQITDMTGIEAFVNLSALNCSQNQITKLNVSRLTKLRKLNCMYNKIDTLDISDNLELEELICGSNLFLTLDLSKNSKLKTLLCLYTKLTTIDVSHNPNLEYMDAGWMNLVILDVSKNPKLSYLDIRGNTGLTSVCVFDTNYAKSNPKFRKDATQKWTENCTVAGMSIEPSPQFSFYPNPAQEQVHLTSQSAGTVTLLDQKGMIVHRYIIKQGENSLPLPVSLVKGLYLLKQDFPEGVFVRKLVVE